MDITQLPSGSYRIRGYYKGKRYSVTVPYKPSNREAKELIEEKIANHVDKVMSFNAAAEKYIKAKAHVLSDSTSKSYRSVAKSVPEWFSKKDIAEIDNYTMQKMVNELSVKHKPKTVRNMYGFCTACIRLFIPSADIHATLPKNVRKEPYIPTVEDVRKLFAYAKDTDYYVPLRLASLSLRRSEILALTIDDLKGNELIINKAMVDSDNGFVIKPTPKNDSSNRTIFLPQDLADRIREQGYVYNHDPGNIYKFLKRALKDLEIPFFSPHKLRHFFASYSHELGYSDAVIQSMGGWSTDYVMKSIYRHAMDKDEAKKSIASDFDL